MPQIDKRPLSAALPPPSNGVLGAAMPDAHSRGSRQRGVRLYNERVVLHTLRKYGALTAADLARRTQLTAQTISLIGKGLSNEGLLLKDEPQRGKVGQPAVPLRLNPEGAFSIGILVGRRKMDLLLVDFVGGIRGRWSLGYSFPEPAVLLEQIGRCLKLIGRKLGRERSSRLQGIGVACPLSLEGWQPLLGVDESLARSWSGIDFRAAVSQLTELPVTLIKDTAAACLAELVIGLGRELRSHLYVFVDTFIGGGLVIDGQLHAGLNGNAGAIGSMAVRPSLDTPGKAPPQLLDQASLFSLETRFARAHLDRTAVTDDRALQPPWRSHTTAWLPEAGDAIGWAVNGAACLLDLDAVVIDGSMGRDFLQALVMEVDSALGRYDWEGVKRPRLSAGSVGADARALGGALLPLHASFAPDRDLFLKLAA
jgi:predicted NBD/HSP70 family sugar kinase